MNKSKNDILDLAKEIMESRYIVKDFGTVKFPIVVMGCPINKTWSFSLHDFFVHQCRKRPSLKRIKEYIEELDSSFFRSMNIYVIPYKKMKDYFYIFFAVPKNKYNEIKDWINSLIDPIDKRLIKTKDKIWIISIVSKDRIVREREGFLKALTAAWIDILKRFADKGAVHFPSFALPLSPDDLNVLKEYYEIQEEHRERMENLTMDIRLSEPQILVINDDGVVVGGIRYFEKILREELEKTLKQRFGNKYRININLTWDGGWISVVDTEKHKTPLILQRKHLDTYIKEVLGQKTGTSVDSPYSDATAKIRGYIGYTAFVFTREKLREFINKLKDVIISTLEHNYQIFKSPIKRVTKYPFMDKILELAEAVNVPIKIITEKHPEYSYFSKHPSVVGIYRIKDKTIYIKPSKWYLTYSTIIHEIAHHIDKILAKKHNIQQLNYSEYLAKKDPKFVDEARKLLLKLGYTTDSTHFKYPDELFAETFEIYVMFPKTLRKISPHLYNIMKEVVNQLPPKAKKIIKELSLEDLDRLEKAIKELEKHKLLDKLPPEILRIITKPANKLTKEEKYMLIRYMLHTHRKGFLIDISRNAQKKAKYVYTWIIKPSRKDLPGIDTRNAKKLLKISR